MQERLKKMLEEAREQLSAANTEKEAEEIRIRFLGKKGQITEVLRSMGRLAPEEKKELGKAANEVKEKIAAALEERANAIKERVKQEKLAAETIDVTEPGVKEKIGVKHPVTQVIEEITDIFRSMGYSVYEGPDIDTVFNTFDGLNAPLTHPARDMSDTFYISKDIVIRPHTSSAEIRAEKELTPPYMIVIPGRCYRCDTPDAPKGYS